MANNPEIHSWYEPESGTWTYLVGDAASGRAAVIDPVWVYDAPSGRVDRTFVDGVLEEAASRGWTIDWVLETHAHADHLSAGALVREVTGAKIAIGRGIREVQSTFAKVFNLSDLATDGRQFDRLLAEGDEVEVGELVFRVMETPGHTRDSLTYLVGDVAFVGDSLFAPGYGTARCDFPGGDAGMLFDSIRRLHALPPDTRLLLCHDYPDEGKAPVSEVTVRESRARNVHVGGDRTREAFIELREARDRTLGLPKLLLPAIQVNIRAGRPPDPENNGVAYLKIPFDLPELNPDRIRREGSRSA